jgi:hypothetical protein
MLDMPMPGSNEALQERAAGVYAGSGPSVAMPGRWQLTIRVVPKQGRAFTAHLVSVLRPATR